MDGPEATWVAASAAGRPVSIATRDARCAFPGLNLAVMFLRTTTSFRTGSRFAMARDNTKSVSPPVGVQPLGSAPFACVKNSTFVVLSPAAHARTDLNMGPSKKAPAPNPLITDLREYVELDMCDLLVCDINRPADSGSRRRQRALTRGSSRRSPRRGTPRTRERDRARRFAPVPVHRKTRTAAG